MTEPISHFVLPTQLRIGLYVYVDLSWMSHPFPVNSFEIKTGAQIATLQSLGLERIRYSPERSRPEEVSLPEEKAEVEEIILKPLVVNKEKSRLSLLVSQKMSLMACERHFAKASLDCKKIFETVLNQPDEARESANKVVVDMLDGLLEEDEVAIRLLSEKGGEKQVLHAVNVTIISLLLGKALQLPKSDMLELGLAALLHDIGKINLPEHIRVLSESGAEADRVIYKTHVAHGVSLAKKMGLSSVATLGIAQHHEYIDGTGYPSKISGNKMHMVSHIISLVNRYDHLCNPNNISLAITPHEALAQLFTKNKAQFHDEVLRSFIKMMGVYPPGSIVRLNDDRFAMVESVNSALPLKPNVIICDPGTHQDEALLINLEHEEKLMIKQSLRPQQLPKEAFDFLMPRKRLSFYYEKVQAFAA